MRHVLAGVYCAAVLLGTQPVVGQMTMSPAPAASSVLPKISLTSNTLAGLPRRTVTVVEDGAKVDYAGVDLGALLARAGAPMGHALHGSAATDSVIIRAADGYRVAFALAEVDPAVTDKIVLLADQRDGAPLGADKGPFRIVVPDEKRHLRWIYSVVEIDVVALP